MTREIFLVYTLLMFLTPIVIALASGQGPWAGYAELFGWLARAAGYGAAWRMGGG